VAPPAGLRERKKQRTRDALRHVALQLFAERGFDQVTVEEIAERADVSRSTFFRYFPTKGDVLADRAGELLAELHGALAVRPEAEPVLRSLRAALQVLARAYEDRQAEFATLRDVAARHPDVQARALEHHSAWEERVAATLAERLGGGASATRRARVAAGAVLAAARVSVDEWIAAEGRLDLEDLLADALDVLGAGLDTALGGEGT
jgi:AcrR family transcriptional regulator